MSFKIEKENLAKRELSALPDDAIRRALADVHQAERYLHDATMHQGISRATHLASAIGWMTMAKDNISKAVKDSL